MYQLGTNHEMVTVPPSQISGTESTLPNSTMTGIKAL